MRSPNISMSDVMEFRQVKYTYLHSNDKISMYRIQNVRTFCVNELQYETENYEPRDLVDGDIFLLLGTTSKYECIPTMTFHHIIWCGELFEIEIKDINDFSFLIS